MLPYWPTVMPPMPTIAWTIIPSAGERRGSDGIAGSGIGVEAERRGLVGVAMRETADAGGGAAGQLHAMHVSPSCVAPPS